MATRKKPATAPARDDFAAALSAWESESPDAWATPKEAKPSKPSAQDGDLAAQLKERFGVSSANRKQRRQGPNASGASSPAASSKSGAPAARPSAQGGSSNTRQLTADELMEEAFLAIDAKHDPTSKYSGRGYEGAKNVEILDEQAVGVVDEAIERYDAIDGHNREDVEFLQLMASADVTPLDRSLDKLRTALDSRSKWQSGPTVQRAPSQGLSPEELEAPVLSPIQRDLLKRARKQSFVPTLNLRHQRRNEALRELAAFVLQHQQQRTRFVRVITGKGRQSEDLPILKPMVIEWCGMDPGNRMVTAFAPETDQSGNFGIIVLELARS